MQETLKTLVWSLGQEDPLEEGMATHSSDLAWRIPQTEEPGEPWSIGSQRVGHDWSTRACTHTTLNRTTEPAPKTLLQRKSRHRWAAGWSAPDSSFRMLDGGRFVMQKAGPWEGKPGPLTRGCVHAKLLQLCSTLMQPCELEPTRLLCPRDSPGENTGVGESWVETSRLQVPRLGALD